MTLIKIFGTLAIVLFLGRFINLNQCFEIDCRIIFKI